MKSAKDRILTGVSLGIVLLAVNILASRYPLRWDLTQGNRFTLSDSTKNMLQDLDDVVTVRLYFSEALPPQLVELKNTVTDLLSEFRGAARGKLQLESIAPESDPQEEQKVRMMGIPPLQVNVVEKDKASVAKVYLGMAIQFGDKQEVIPVASSTDNLEYELSSSILKVTQNRKPLLGLILPNMASGSVGGDFNLIRQQLEKRFEVKTIEEDKLSEIDSATLSALIWIVSGDAAEPLRKAIDQYLMQGGKVLVFADAVEVKEGLRVAPLAGNVLDQLKSYGVEVRSDLVLDRASAMATFSGGMISYHIPYAYWPEVQGDGFARVSPVTAKLQSLVFPWASGVRVGEVPEGAKIELLATTTNFGVASAVGSEMTADPNEARDLLATGSHEVIPLAVLRTGKMKSFFDSNQEAGETHLMVAGTTRLLQDNFLKQFQNNLVFIENAVDFFAQGDQLIGIRSKGSAERPLEVVSDGVRVGVKTVNMVLGPMVLLAYGLVSWSLRRARHKNLQTAYGV